MKPQAKKEWKTPELIVLVRSKPEEAVLTACKAMADGSGSNTLAGGCAQGTQCDPDCPTITLS
jgi:hypothetical protein